MPLTNSRARDPEAIQLFRLACAFLVLGFIWRLTRYLLCAPLWVDEVMLTTNFFTPSLQDVVLRLGNCQVAPALFLTGEWLALHSLGPSELSMRLLPFAASVAGLLLFACLIRQSLSPRAATLALGLMALSSWPVTMTALIKPYSLDLCLSVFLLWLAFRHLESPTQHRWLTALTVAVPFVLLASYPAVFVAGSVSVAVAASAWGGRWRARALFLAYNLTMAVGFFTAYWIGKSQLGSPFGSGETQTTMAACWSEGFPPPTLWGWPIWLVQRLTGQVMGYPFGSVDGAGLLTLALVLLGSVVWYRQGRRAGLVLVLGPFLLHLLAATVGRYPFGPTARVAQHLAPSICLLAGTGLAELIQWTGTAIRRRVTCGIGMALLLFGIGALTRDVLKPYRDEQARWTREMVRDLDQRVLPESRLVIVGKPDSFGLLEWYWKARQTPRVAQVQGLEEYAHGRRELWVIGMEPLGQRMPQALAALKQHDPTWNCPGPEWITRPAGPHGDGGERYALLRFRRTP